ncbi:MAG: hypothetical protein MZV64_08500 [Ignavibacteriales bacterium]|nr:hypothetical protein [Ignavibacteriales bacterium]
MKILILMLTDHITIIEFCKEKKIDLSCNWSRTAFSRWTCSDHLEKSGLKVFGPISRMLLKLNHAKHFAKKVMNEADVPTAKYIEFSSSQYVESAIDYLEANKLSNV